MLQSDIFELIKTFLPKYLSAEDAKLLTEYILESFPESKSAAKVYSLTSQEYFCQGDLVQDIPFAKWDIDSQQFITLYSDFCIISNTCDIFADNKRWLEPNIMLASIIPLKEYETRLGNSGIEVGRIQNHLIDLKGNRITNIFYLPERKSGSSIIFEESIVVFDITTNFPVSTLNKYSMSSLENGGDRIASLSNYGFFTLIFKLSVHFCRLREGVFRN